MRQDSVPAAAVVFRSQLGHVTRRQLLDLGLSYSTIRRRVTRGVLLPVGAATFRDSGVAPSLEGEVIAACLDHGGVASHRTATWMHGALPWPGVIDITTVDEGSKNLHRRPASSPAAPVYLHSSTNLPVGDRIEVRGVPCTSVARSLFGLAGLVPHEVARQELVEVVGRAIDLKLATPGWLWWLLAQRRCRGRNGVSVFESVLAELGRLGPTESWLERELLSLIDRAALRLPTTQRVVKRQGRFAARVDAIYEPERVVIEALGYAFHRTKKQTSADTARANELQLLGYRVLQFTTEHIVDGPDLVVETIRRAVSSLAVG